MTQCTDKLVARLAEGVAKGGDAGRFDIWRELGRMTLAVVGSTAYGVDFATMDTEETETTK